MKIMKVLIQFFVNDFSIDDGNIKKIEENVKVEVKFILTIYFIGNFHLINKVDTSHEPIVFLNDRWACYFNFYLLNPLLYVQFAVSPLG